MKAVWKGRSPNTRVSAKSIIRKPGQGAGRRGNVVTHNGNPVTHNGNPVSHNGNTVSHTA